MTTTMTNFDQFILHLAMQLLDAPSILEKLQEQPPSDKDSNSNRRNANRSRSPFSYWRSPLKNDATTMNATTAASDGDNSHTQQRVIFLDVTFDFSSSLSPLAVFGVLMESSSSSSNAAVYVKSSPFTFSQWKQHFDDIGVDVDCNDARDIARSMSQSLKFGPIKNVTVTTSPQVNTAASSASSSPAPPAENRQLTLDITYQDLADTGRLRLDVQQSSDLDVAMFHLLLSNAWRAEEFQRQLRSVPNKIVVTEEDCQRKLDVIQQVLDLWQQQQPERARRLAALEASRAKSKQPPPSPVREPIADGATAQPNDSSSCIHQPVAGTSDDDAVPESTESVVAAVPADSCAVAPDDVNTESEKAPASAIATATTNNNHNNGKATVVVKRVVTKTAAINSKASRNKRRKVGGKLTYANNP